MTKKWTKEEAFVFRLQKGMKDNNINVTILARKVNKHPSTLRKWIKEIRCCHESFMPLLAKALGVSVYELTKPPTEEELLNYKGDNDPKTITRY